jgi:hypothetical protein
MFLDESGTHKLTKIEPTYPVFVLGGVVIDRAYVRDVIEIEMNQFKQRYFGRTDIVLHTVEMNNGTGDYAFLADTATRTAFYDDLHTHLQSWDYKVIACVIKKPELVKRYGTAAKDPYMYSLDILVERFCNELDEELDAGFICAEKRGGSLDRELMIAWENLRTRGTRYMGAHQIDCRIVSLDLRDKKPNLAGMQLADLVITPIGRHIVGATPKPNRVRWPVVEGKLRRVKGAYMGYGLVIRP